MSDDSEDLIREIIPQVSRELAKYETEVGFSRMKAGVAAEIAVRTAFGLVRAQTLAEAADAIDADAAGRLDTHQAWLRKSAELVRGL